MKAYEQTSIWTGAGLLSIMPFFLLEGYLGNPLSHFIMEIAGAFLAISAAVWAVNCCLDGK